MKVREGKNFMEKSQKYDLTIFIEGLNTLNISLTDFQIEQFMDYYELLIERNKVMNLTAITEFKDVIQKHFLDSLSMVKVFNPRSERILDLGTGAGFPGIPLKIAYPELTVVLMDSLNKRIHFLEEVINTLKLENITAIHGRAEDYGRTAPYRESFDLCVSRAVAKLPTLSEYCLPFVKSGGYFIPYKSGQVEEEMISSGEAVKILGAVIEKAEKFTLPGTDIDRTLILIHKLKVTPKKYPRPAGKPSKEPL